MGVPRREGEGVVPEARLELAQAQGPEDFESSASTNSTTPAQRLIYEKSRVLSIGINRDQKMLQAKRQAKKRDCRLAGSPNRSAYPGIAGCRPPAPSLAE